MIKILCESLCESLCEKNIPKCAKTGENWKKYEKRKTPWLEGFQVL